MKPWISLTISSLAMLLSLIALGVSLPIVGDLNFDYYGAIIGVLSFLITVLMGYQIYTVINVKEELKEMIALRKSIDSKLIAQKDAITSEYKEEFENTLPLFIALSKQEMDEMIVNSLKVFTQSHNGSWTRGFAHQTLVLTLLGIPDDMYSMVLENVCSRVTEKDVVAFYNFVNEQDEAGNFPDAVKMRQRLNTLLSKIKPESNGEEV